MQSKQPVLKRHFVNQSSRDKKSSLISDGKMSTCVHIFLVASGVRKKNYLFDIVFKIN